MNKFVLHFEYIYLNLQSKINIKLHMFDFYGDNDKIRWINKPTTTYSGTQIS